MSKNYNTIIYEIGGPEDAVCNITLNRPEARNAIDREMAEEMLDAFKKVRDEAGVKVVVFSGAGKSFCSGGDLSLLPTFNHQTVMDWLARTGYDIIHNIAESEKIVVAKIHGHCLAGGLELALACDLIYASERTKFGVTEITMGILPGWGGTVRLAKSLPIHRAKEILLTGSKDYTAKEIYEMGGLTRVFGVDEFEQKVDEIVANLCLKSNDALRMGKSVLNRAHEGLPWNAAMTLERNAIMWLQESEFTTNMRNMALKMMDQK